MKAYGQALKHIADIIERGIREHPGKTTFQQIRLKVLLDCDAALIFISFLYVKAKSKCEILSLIIYVLQYFISANISQKSILSM